MHQIIKLDRVTSVVVQKREVSKVKIALEHKYVDVHHLDMTPDQALEVADALTKAARLIKAERRKKAGEGAQGVHPQRIEKMGNYVAKYLAKGGKSGRINWPALVMLGALAGFWVAFGMAIKTAIEAGAVVL